MKKIIIANMKMNFTREKTKKYLKELLTLTKDSEHQIVVCLPFTSLSVANQMLFGKDIFIGAQNVHQEESGAYTGEVSAEMLKELDCEYVIVGHSERRQYFGEENKTINSKIKTLMKYGIKPILCIGETKQQRRAGKTQQVLSKQLETAFSGLYENELGSIVVAYEPIWAIGTGVSATSKEALEAIKYIRSVIKQNYSEEISKQINIVYGGSVKPDNAKTYLTHKQINGGLIGGASLNAKTFANIVKEA